MLSKFYKVESMYCISCNLPFRLYSSLHHLYPQQPQLQIDPSSSVFLLSATSQPGQLSYYYLLYSCQQLHSQVSCHIIICLPAFRNFTARLGHIIICHLSCQQIHIQVSCHINNGFPALSNFTARLAVILLSVYLLSAISQPGQLSCYYLSSQLSAVSHSGQLSY